MDLRGVCGGGGGASGASDGEWAERATGLLYSGLFLLSGKESQQKGQFWFNFLNVKKLFSTCPLASPPYTHTGAVECARLNF